MKFTELTINPFMKPGKLPGYDTATSLNNIECYMFDRFKFN